MSGLEGLLAMTDSYEGRRHGALAVLETRRSRDDVNRQLRELHAGLFVEQQLREETLGKPFAVWCVCLDTGIGGIATVYEWREQQPDGPPIPYLSDAVVEEMKRRYQRGPVELAVALEHNKRRQEKLRGEYRDEVTAMVDEHHKAAQPTHSAGFHRGVGLRQARDRQRAKGKKV